MTSDDTHGADAEKAAAEKPTQHPEPDDDAASTISGGAAVDKPATPHGSGAESTAGAA